MKAGKKNPEKRGLPIITAGVTAFLLIAGLLFLIPRPAKLPDKPTVTPSIAKSDCVISGCSSELCVDKKDGDIASTCIWSDSFACVKYSTCERQKDDQCGWTKTEKYQQCLDKLSR